MPTSEMKTPRLRSEGFAQQPTPGKSSLDLTVAMWGHHSLTQSILYM